MDDANKQMSNERNWSGGLDEAAGHGAQSQCRWGSMRQGRNRLAAVLQSASQDSLIQNSLFIIANAVVTSAFGFLYWLVAARLFSPTVVGLTAAVTSAGTVILLLSSLGVGGALIQSLPGRRANEWSVIVWAGLATSVFVAATLTLLAVAALPEIAPEMDALRNVQYAAVFAAGTMAMAIGATFDHVFISDRHARYLFLRNSVAAAIKVIALASMALVAIREAEQLLWTWSIAAVGGLVIGVLLLARKRRISRPPRLAIIWRTAVSFLDRMTGHQAIGLGTGLLPYLLPLLVTARLSAEDNAYFFTTWMLAGLFLIVSSAVSQSLFAEGVNRPGDLSVITKVAAKTIASILVPALIIISIFGARLLGIFGQEYSDNALVLLHIAVIAAIPDAITNVYGGILRVRHRLKAAACLNVAIGLGTLLVSWVLLPHIGISAVGVAFLGAQLCGCIFVFWDGWAHGETVRFGRGAMR